MVLACMIYITCVLLDPKRTTFFLFISINQYTKAYEHMLVLLSVGSDEQQTDAGDDDRGR